MIISKKYAPGVIFVIVSLLYAIYTFSSYKLGSFDKPGPGLFPFVVSTVLFIVGIFSLMVNSDGHWAVIDIKTLSIVVSGIVVFALLTSYVNMALGIVSLAVITSFANKTKVQKSTVVKISIVLILMASAFKYVLGLGIPLWK